MGFIRDIAKKVSSYIPKIELPKPSLPNPVALVEKGAQLAKDSFNKVAKPLVDLGAPVIPSLVPEGIKQVAHAWTDQLGKAADRLGSGLQVAGGLLEKGGKLMGPFNPVGEQFKVLGSGAKLLGSGVAAAPEAAAYATGALMKEADNLAKKGVELLDQAKKAVDSGVDAAKQGLEIVENGVKGLANSAKEYIEGVAKAVDYNENIDKLGVGDKYTLGIGGNATVYGVRGYGKGQIEVEKKPDGSYSVTADGELGAGVAGGFGVKNVEGAATLGLGAKVEFSAKTPAEAKKLTEILLKQAAASAASSGGGQPMLQLPGQLLAKAIGPSREELKKLGDHVSAVEVRGTAAAEIAASLGIKDIAGAQAGGKVKEEVSARLDYSSKPATVSLKTTLSGEVNGGIGLAPSNGQDGDGARGGSLSIAGGKVEGKVEVEQKFDLPSNLDLNKLKSDPIGTVRSMASNMVKSEKDKVTMTLDASGGVLGGGGGVETKVTLETDAARLAKSGAYGKLFNGDLKGALRAAGDNADVAIESTPYKRLGVNIAPGIMVGVFGGGVEFEASRKDVADKPMFRYPAEGQKLTASEAFDQLDALLQQYSPYLIDTGGPRQIRG